MSPYEDRYVDVKFVDKIAGYVTMASLLSYFWFCFIVVDTSGQFNGCWSFSCHYYPLFQLGASSFLLHHFSMLINSILVSFGLSEEMHNPTSNLTGLTILVWPCDLTCKMRFDLGLVSQLFVNQLPWTPCTTSILHFGFEAVSQLQQSIISFDSTLYNELMLGVVNSSSFETVCGSYWVGWLWLIGIKVIEMAMVELISSDFG
ncbi:hypothetical protein ACSBR2_029971 [Camellia fascicularis]